MAILWAKIVPNPGGEHTSRADGTRSYRQHWQVRVDSPLTTEADVRASDFIPAEGLPLYRHGPTSVLLDPYGGYRRIPDGAGGFLIDDDQVRVVTREVRRSPDPYYFDAVIYYEGVNDPTAETPDVSSETVEYQEYTANDVNGRPVMNSAFDPIDGGMPRDGFFKRILITRNLPYEAWSQQRGDTYAKTLNRERFFLGNQVEAGQPAFYEPGQVLLKSIAEQRVLRHKGQTLSQNSYYWRVTAELHVDLERVRFPDGTNQLRCHRWVQPDAGFNALLPVDPAHALPSDPHKLRPIRMGHEAASQPFLLDGQGRPLLKNSQQMKPQFVPFTRSSELGGLGVDWFATPTNTALTVTVTNAQTGYPGLLANDSPGITQVEQVGGSNVGGTAAVTPDGGFTFTPTVDYVGWAKFKYKAVGAADNTAQDVFILVGAVPYLLLFDRYRHRTWTGIDSLLTGW